MDQHAKPITSNKEDFNLVPKLFAGRWKSLGTKLRRRGDWDSAREWQSLDILGQWRHICILCYHEVDMRNELTVLSLQSRYTEPLLWNVHID